MIGSLRHRPHQSSLGIPNSVDTIVGDGNCLYRALSLEITGTQAHHEQVREIIVDFMIKNPRPFSAYLGCDLQEYLVEGGSPLQPKTWGTDVEVMAAATLLQTPVVVDVFCHTDYVIAKACKHHHPEEGHGGWLLWMSVVEAGPAGKQRSAQRSVPAGLTMRELVMAIAAMFRAVGCDLVAGAVVVSSPVV
ncbi:hypothetical protein ACOMHN_045770 [Nucella lapillus]